MKTLNILTFASPLHDQSELFSNKREILSWLKSKYSVTITDGSKLASISLPYVLFIGTGGTERQLMSQIDKLPQPLVILSDSYHNSQAASLEISSWLHNQGIMHKHLNYPAKPGTEYLDSLTADINMLVAAQNTLAALKGMKIGLLGGESDWLISSGIDRNAVEKRYGVQFIDVSIERIIKLYSEAESKEVPADFVSRLSPDRKPEDIAKAYKMYCVLKQLCINEGLSAITIKCFDLLQPCDTTACLALALLNDEGIIAGCEGDIPSLWSMVLAKQLCGSASFMANPSSIDRSSLSIDFAHCTVPTTLSDSYKLPSHYESRMGIAIAATMKLGKYTLFKCGSEKLDRFYAFEGEMVQNTSVVERCRTQIKFRFKSEAEIDQFLNAHLGNHVILIPGHCASTIKMFF